MQGSNRGMNVGWLYRTMNGHLATRWIHLAVKWTAFAWLAGLSAWTLPAAGQDSGKPREPSWNGYIQTRFSNDYRNQTGFTVRRAKFWSKGKAPVAGRWFYKVQGMFRSQNEGAFSLQDVYAEYRGKGLVLRFGQQIPRFSLQRFQPDARIPAIERGGVIGALIPAAETVSRDIGVQAKYNFSNGRGFTSVGVFNGNGANNRSNEDRRLLYVHRTELQILGGSTRVRLGYSLAYRETSGLVFKKIHDSAFRFVGTDFRWGLDALLTGGYWTLQAEYLQARLEDDTARGYYVIGSVKLTPENVLLLSVDQYLDLRESTDDRPWFILGFNRLFDSYRVKASFDQRIQFGKDRTAYETTVQLQLFFR